MSLSSAVQFLIAAGNDIQATRYAQRKLQCYIICKGILLNDLFHLHSCIGIDYRL